MEKEGKSLHVIVREESSTNGRWGMVITAPEKVEIQSIVRGELFYHGTHKGKEIYHYVPSRSGKLYNLFGEDVECVVGCKIVKSINLQSNNYASIVVCDDKIAVYKQYGYKRRSFVYHVYKNGKEVMIPAEALVTMGIIPSESIPVEITPPEVNPSLAEALKKAGY